MHTTHTMVMAALLTACGPEGGPTSSSAGPTSSTDDETTAELGGDLPGECTPPAMLYRPLRDCEDLTGHPPLGELADACCELVDAPRSCVLPSGAVCHDARVYYPPPPSEYAELGMYACCDLAR